MHPTVVSSHFPSLGSKHYGIAWAALEGFTRAPLTQLPSFLGRTRAAKSEDAASGVSVTRQLLQHEQGPTLAATARRSVAQQHWQVGVAHDMAGDAAK
jgi:hypothetical protein